MQFASSTRRTFLSLAGSLLAFALIAGCSSTPKPTIVATTISASDDVNPDSTGRPSPLVVRLYELKTLSTFNDADFFSLWDSEGQTLAADLNGREEMVLRPGDRNNEVRVVKPGTRFIGVVAAYRDLERSVWRGSVAVSPNKTLPVMIRFDDRAVTVSATGG